MNSPGTGMCRESFASDINGENHFAFICSFILRSNSI